MLPARDHPTVSGGYLGDIPSLVLNNVDKFSLVFVCAPRQSPSHSYRYVHIDSRLGSVACLACSDTTRCGAAA